MCDGYETIKSIRYGDIPTVCHSRTRIHPIRPPPLGVPPYAQISDTARGRRSFAYFLHQVGHDLSQAFQTPVLHQLILQMSHCDNAVREAVIALGSLGERLQFNSVLTWDNQQANECHEYAVAEYGKAISHLRGQLSDGGEKLELQALIMCFLFTIFEFLQGNGSGALIHLRHGLRILDKVHRPEHESSVLAEQEAILLEMERTGNSIIKTRTKPITAKDRLAEELVRTYTVMENQALYWLSLESWETPLLAKWQTMYGDPPNCEHFPTLEEAADALNYHINIVQEIRCTFISVEASEASASLTSLLAFNNRKRDWQIQQLLKWPTEVQAMQTRLADGWTDTMTHRINVMKMNYTITLLLLEGVFEPIGVVSNRNSELAFEEVIRLAKTILLPLDDDDDDVKRMTRIRQVVLANNKDINPDAVFSFYAGLIQPLYNTAIKCQNLAICQEAIDLLATRPWREGAWESAGMAKIARKKCEDRWLEIPASGSAAC